MYLQKLISKKTLKKIYLSLTKRAGSGTVLKCHGSTSTKKKTKDSVKTCFLTKLAQNMKSGDNLTNYLQGRNTLHLYK